MSVCVSWKGSGLALTFQVKSRRKVKGPDASESRGQVQQAVNPFNLNPQDAEKTDLLVARRTSSTCSPAPRTLPRQSQCSPHR